MCRGGWRCHAAVLRLPENSSGSRAAWKEGICHGQQAPGTSLQPSCGAFERKAPPRMLFEHPPRCGVRAQWSFLNLCLSSIAVIENSYFKYYSLGQVGPSPNSFLQDWTDSKPGFLLKPSLTAWSVLPKSCLSFQTLRKSKPNCFYLKVSLRCRKEL